MDDREYPCQLDVKSVRTLVEVLCRRNEAGHNRRVDQGGSVVQCWRATLNTHQSNEILNSFARESVCRNSAHLVAALVCVAGVVDLVIGLHEA